MVLIAETVFGYPPYTIWPNLFPHPPPCWAVFHSCRLTCKALYRRLPHVLMKQLRGVMMIMVDGGDDFALIRLRKAVMHVIQMTALSLWKEQMGLRDIVIMSWLKWYKVNQPITTTRNQREQTHKTTSRHFHSTLTCSIIILILIIITISIIKIIKRHHGNQWLLTIIIQSSSLSQTAWPSSSSWQVSSRSTSPSGKTRRFLIEDHKNKLFLNMDSDWTICMNSF